MEKIFTLLKSWKLLLLKVATKKKRFSEAQKLLACDYIIFLKRSTVASQEESSKTTGESSPSALFTKFGGSLFGAASGSPQKVVTNLRGFLSNKIPGNISIPSVPDSGMKILNLSIYIFSDSHQKFSIFPQEFHLKLLNHDFYVGLYKQPRRNQNFFFHYWFFQVENFSQLIQIFTKFDDICHKNKLDNSRSVGKCGKFLNFLIVFNSSPFSQWKANIFLFIIHPVVLLCLYLPSSLIPTCFWLHRTFSTPSEKKIWCNIIISIFARFSVVP